MSRLERWSRKKRGIESDDIEKDVEQKEKMELADHEEGGSTLAAEQEATKQEATEPTIAEQKVAAPPPPGSLDHTLPDPDTLPAGSDFSAFMVPGVSAALRRRALRRLWATGNYNVRDGLDDYDADYTQQLKPMASELAGKLRRWANKAEEALERAEHRDNDDSSDHANADGVNACTSDDSFVQSAPLDDQSDFCDHAPDERKKGV
ncbi:DUF3306 domain-containing protein [Vreelandella aquamarina]|uniref:DUF3306 domain-containing protein n=1 Tax=Vreelandella aquamarina TaxID=77097 RepID=UPI00384B7703